jgi:hypothetical protein
MEANGYGSFLSLYFLRAAHINFICDNFIKFQEKKFISFPAELQYSCFQNTNLLVFIKFLEMFFKITIHDLL